MCYGKTGQESAEGFYREALAHGIECSDDGDVDRSIFAVVTSAYEPVNGVFEKRLIIGVAEGGVPQAYTAFNNIPAGLGAFLLGGVIDALDEMTFDGDK